MDHNTACLKVQRKNSKDGFLLWRTKVIHKMTLFYNNDNASF